MNLKYLERRDPPICIHALGQGLCNALFSEGRALLHSQQMLLRACQLAWERNASHQLLDYEECNELREVIRSGKLSVVDAPSLNAELLRGCQAAIAYLASDEDLRQLGYAPSTSGASAGDANRLEALRIIQNALERADTERRAR